MRACSRIAIGLFLLALGSSAMGSDVWPGFRGPTGLGLSDETALPLKWSVAENVVWKAPLPGAGHASPVVWKDKVFVCTVFWPPHGEPVSAVIPEQHVTCFNASDGKQLWDTLVPKGPWIRNDFRSGPGGGYAGPTPVTDGKLLYCVFGSAVIAALDFDGKIAWKQEIVPFTFDVTIGGSPVLYKDTVLLFCPSTSEKDTRLVAYDNASGKISWTTPIAHMGFSHSTPTLVQVDNTPQLLVVGGGMGTTDEALQSLDPADGHQLWFCRGAGESASVAYGDGIVYFDSGRGSMGTAVSPAGAVGDVSKTHIRWTIPNIPEAIGSPIIVNGCVYRLCSPGVLHCWDAATGKQLYQHRLEGITTTWASPIADASGHIFFASAGKSFVIEASREFKLISTNDLGDPNHPSPAAAAGRLYLEGEKNLFCVGSAGK